MSLYMFNAQTHTCIDHHFQSKKFPCISVHAYAFSTDMAESELGCVLLCAFKPTIANQPGQLIPDNQLFGRELSLEKSLWGSYNPRGPCVCLCSYWAQMHKPKGQGWWAGDFLLLQQQPHYHRGGRGGRRKEWGIFTTIQEV